ncbi:MAG TPA: glycoside hydrolase family 3 C-terminal domain-containing protein [Polyangia bacterium]|jgi:beta-glucosidase
MSIKSFQLLFLLSTVVGFAALPACKLDPPKISGMQAGFVCSEDTDGGVAPVDAEADAADDGGDGGDAGNGIDNVVPPVSCTADNAMAFPYAPGYTTDVGVKGMVDSTITKMSLSDKAWQMRGTKYGNPFGAQFTDIQRSIDTAGIRGFRYRDASRGMNLGEDMSGHRPNAGKLNGEHVGFSTAFPVSMARGAAWDLDLEYAIGEAIGDEMQAAKETLLLAPCMNLLRHPFWGRAQETYGEDSYHIGRLATAMTLGVQQHIAANAKHFMAYDIEKKREQNNSQLDEQTLREVYGRHFRMVVQDGGVASVMASYNKVNGIKSTQNAHTLTDVLRTDFGFKGFVLSDWWAMPASSAASTDPTILAADAVMAVKAGLDVDLPWALSYGQLEKIVASKAGLTEDDLNVSVRRVLEQKFRFNAQPLTGAVGIGSQHTLYSKSRISCDGTHIALAEKAALESMVLLKNDGGTLPIKQTTATVAVVGATVPYLTTNGGSTNTGGLVNFAQDVRTGDLGSSRVYSDPKKDVGAFAGICMAAGGVPMEVADANNVRTSGTCENAPPINVTTATTSDGDLSPAMAAASAADFVVVVAGLTAQDEGEDYTQAADRDSLSLDAKQTDPKFMGIQNNLITAVAGLGKPMVVVLIGGSVIDMPWLTNPNVKAVVMAWYPGMVGGTALGKLLFGKANFSGKLPLTWGKRAEDYDTWNGMGTTMFNYYVGYHWFDFKGITPVYPFGYGLSYTNYEYRKLQLGCSDMTKGAVLPVVVNVANTGTVAGDEIVEVYVSFVGTTARRPAKELKGFARVHLEAGQEKQITIPVRLSDLDYFQTDSADPTAGKWVVETGTVKVQVGGSSDKLPLTQTVLVNGY